MAPTPEEKPANGRKARRLRPSPNTTARKTASRETTSLDRAVGRQNEHLIKENERLQDEIRELKRNAEDDKADIDVLRDRVHAVLEDKGGLRADNERLMRADDTRKRVVRRLKSEIERLRTERDSYRGALAACEPEVERHLSERLDGPPTVATIPMVAGSDRDFEEVDRPHWFDL